VAVVRSSEPLPGIIAAVKQRVAELDPSIRMGMSVLRTQVREGLARERLMAWLSCFFGVLAAVLVMIGLYGLLSFITLTRRNELGIRLALGARRGNILWLVLRHGLKLAGIGVAIGLAGSFALTRFLRGLLFGIDPNDPVTLAAISLLLIAVASLACWLPAHRAARVDPMEALRYE
jgi:ABC-type antimicrobial peptide transport system permease subunit